MTEPQKTDKLATADQERLRFTLETMQEGLWDWNIATGEFYFSPRWLQSLGYTSLEAPGQVEFFFAIVHPQDAALAQSTLEEHRSGRTPAWECEIRLRNKSGAYVWFFNRGNVVVRDATGNATRVVGTITDVTERRRTVEALAESERRLRWLFGQTAIGVVEADLARGGHFVRVNQRFCDMLGYTEAELLALQVRDMTLSDEPGEDSEPWRRMTAGEIREFTLDKRYRRKDGGALWGRLIVSALWQAGETPGAALGMIQDMTESRRVSERLAQAERLCRGLFDAADDAIIIFRPGDRVVLEANERACKLYGFTRAEFIGMSLESIFAQAAWEKLQIEETLERESALRLETEQFRRDGSLIPVEFSASVVDFEGERAILSIHRDVTWRKEAEAKLARAERREALAQLAGGIAHEFNSTLLAAGNFLHGSASSNDPAVAKAAALVQQMQTLSASLLELFAGPEQMTPPVLEIGAWLPRCVSELSGLLPPGVTITAESASEVEPVRVEPLALEQVLRILVGNASEAMSGPGEIRVVWGLSRSDKPGIEIRVADTGCGIPEEIRGRVFEPFFTTRGRSRRSGLGLAIASRLVEQFGGSLSYQPNEPQGSVFIIWLRSAPEELA